jgi:hypothetical protein
MKSIPLNPSLIFLIVGKGESILQLNKLTKMEFSNATTLCILGEHNSTEDVEQYSSIILNELNNNGVLKWHRLEDDQGNLKTVNIDYTQGNVIDERILFIFTTKQDITYKPWESVDKTRKTQLTSAFESFTTGYYFATKFFHAVDVGPAIKTPIETLIELIYILHNEIMDPNAVILDIGCGIPAFMSGLSLMTEGKPIYGSETNPEVQQNLQIVIDTFQSKNNIDHEVSTKYFSKAVEKVKNKLLIL